MGRQLDGNVWNQAPLIIEHGEGRLGIRNDPGRQNDEPRGGGASRLGRFLSASGETRIRQNE